MLSVDQGAIANTWDDVAFVTVTIVDENGTIIPNADNLVTFKTEGAGTVAAVDSADNNSHESYQAATRRAYNGICFAMLKANSGKGKITLTATAPNLKSSSITVNVAKAK